MGLPSPSIAEYVRSPRSRCHLGRFNRGDAGTNYPFQATPANNSEWAPPLQLPTVETQTERETACCILHHAAPHYSRFLCLPPLSCRPWWTRTRRSSAWRNRRPIRRQTRTFLCFMRSYCRHADMCSLPPDVLGASHVRRFLPEHTVKMQLTPFPATSDSFDVPSFFQLHDLDRCVLRNHPLPPIAQSFFIAATTGGTRRRLRPSTAFTTSTLRRSRRYVRPVRSSLARVLRWK